MIIEIIEVKNIFFIIYIIYNINNHTIDINSRYNKHQYVLFIYFKMRILI